MTTAIAKPITRYSDFRTLRKQAEELMKQMERKKKEISALLERLEGASDEPSPRPSPLDKVQELLKVTEDLRAPNGNLSAMAVANAFGVSVNELAGWLGRSRQSLAKTPDADSLQNDLAFFERVA